MGGRVGAFPGGVVADAHEVLRSVDHLAVAEVNVLVGVLEVGDVEVVLNVDVDINLGLGRVRTRAIAAKRRPGSQIQ